MSILFVFQLICEWYISTTMNGVHQPSTHSHTTRRTEKEIAAERGKHRKTGQMACNSHAHSSHRELRLSKIFEIDWLIAQGTPLLQWGILASRTVCSLCFGFPPSPAFHLVAWHISHSKVWDCSVCNVNLL